jgi:hypothetical protein
MILNLIAPAALLPEPLHLHSFGDFHLNPHSQTISHLFHNHIGQEVIKQLGGLLNGLLLLSESLYSLQLSFTITVCHS